jgi:hypothetical protein
VVDGLIDFITYERLSRSFTAWRVVFFDVNRLSEMISETGLIEIIIPIDRLKGCLWNAFICADLTARLFLKVGTFFGRFTRTGKGLSSETHRKQDSPTSFGETDESYFAQLDEFPSDTAGSYVSRER